MNRLVLSDVSYRYPKNNRDVFSNVSLSFHSGKVYCVIGESGVGKSTLLKIISGLIRPDTGTMSYNDQIVSDYEEYRRNVVSSIFQDYLLFPNRTVLENVMYPLALNGQNKQNQINKAKQYLEMVNLPEELFDKYPDEISGGEQQRTAIARCLSTNSEIITADEPTGNLDYRNAAEVIDLLMDLAHSNGKIIVIVTHDLSIAEKCDECYELRYGRLLP